VGVAIKGAGRHQAWDDPRHAPKALLERLLRTGHTSPSSSIAPADGVLSRFFREHQGLGARERDDVTESRVRPVVAKSSCSTTWRHPALARVNAAFQFWVSTAQDDFLRSALNEQEKWLDQCRQIRIDDLMDRHRHNLPDWLVPPLKDQLGAEFWPFVAALDPAGALGVRAGQRPERQAR